MKNIRLIACLSKNNGIGLNNQLLFNIKDDMLRFKGLTTNNIVVMGFKTFQSLNCKKLPNRINIVLTSKKLPEKLFKEDGLLFVHDMSELNRTLEELNFIYPTMSIYVIGGQVLFMHFINIAEYLHITHVDRLSDADTFFPQIDNKIWKVEWSQLINGFEQDSIGSINRVSYEFVDYKRI